MPKLRRMLPCLPAAAAALALAPAAHAATVSVDYGAKSLTYTAAPGEANRLSIAYDAATEKYVIADPGAASLTLTVMNGGGGNSCSRSQETVVCTAPNVNSIAIALGDYDDTLVAKTDIPVTVDGGNGADTLETGSGSDTLVGGNGADTLIGGGGGDTYIGGNGPDTVDYSAATTPVRVTEDGVANDGVTGTDNVGADVETVIGGSADDVLHASPAGGTLEGGPGNDTLYGGPGDDVLDGGPGSDHVAGGAGDDRILVQDGAVDEVDCGDGADAVSNDLEDSLTPDCETRDVPLPAAATGGASHGAPDIVLPVRPVSFATRHSLRVTLGCATSALTACHGDVYVEVPARYLVRPRPKALHAARGHYVAQSRRIAHRRFRIRRGKTLTAQVPIAFRGHYVFRNRSRIKARLRVVERDASGKVLGVTTRPVVLERKWSRRTRR